MKSELDLLNQTRNPSSKKMMFWITFASVCLSHNNLMLSNQSTSTIIFGSLFLLGFYFLLFYDLPVLYLGALFENKVYNVSETSSINAESYINKINEAREEGGVKLHVLISSIIAHIAFNMSKIGFFILFARFIHFLIGS